MTQLTFDLGHRPALDREDFLVAPCNRAAVAWIDRWPDWPAGRARALMLWGPPGCGKTHLGHVWRQASDAVLVDGRHLAERDALDLAATAHAVLVEDFLSATPRPAAAQQGLLHIFNGLAERGGTLMVTGTAAPSRSAIDLADLRSRLNASTVAAIEAPDDALLAAVLVKQFQDRQLAVGEDVIVYLLRRMERSFAAATQLVERLDKAALAGHRDVTRSLAREVLETLADADG